MKTSAPKLATLLLASSLAMPAQAFDLLEAWYAARQYDSGFAAQKAERNAGLEKRDQGRALLLPQLGLSSSISRSNDIEPGVSGSYSSHGWGAELKQPLFDVGAWTGYQKGKISSALADTRFTAAEQALILSVARAYFDVLLAQDTLSSTLAAKKSFEKQLAQAKKAFEVGTATILDSYEAQASYNAASAREISAINQLEVKRNALGTLTGLVNEGISPLKGKIALSAPDPDSADAWITRALNNNPAIAISEQQTQLARQNVTAARGNHLPKLALTAGYQDQSTNNPRTSFTDNRGSSIGLNLTIPLYAGGGINSQVREAVALQEQAGEQLESSKRKVREEVRAAFLGVSNGAALVQANEQLLLSAKNKVDATRLGREVGLRTILDLLQAEQAYYEAERQLSESRYGYLFARLQLAQASGELSEATLRSVNRYF
ncbi:TolC family outer membrane protein [Craterilacuibacter sinensis]|uniref:TolC family outer membrane protein n=1 Tax=Craterilacuibacter sinensis TaxID=2686017 RepID=A0A845BLQ7_9NEIS|nr:TolC family outer membrane protein [Craterilacuibacter sinensis]MXR35391.1 TolC family outer membrane protein [Craterilacuibacter sinensis]